MSIKAISGNDIHSITSGQVITDLNSCIKELLENSIDANATQIEIMIKNYGCDSIEIQDDGDGIKKENFESLCLKNYTSKITNFEDISSEHFDSLGFRGEALSSICCLSKLSIVTATVDSTPVAYSLNYNIDGTLASTKKTSRNKGTTISIEDFFYNLPVRRKNLLKNSKRNFQKCVQLIQDYCIINKDIHIKCWHITAGNRKNLVISNSSRKTTLLKNLITLFGSSSLKGVEEIAISINIDPKKSFIEEYNFEGGQVQLSGCISKNSFGCGRTSKDKQFIFINKRPIDYPKIVNVINEVYKSFNNVQFPFFVLNFDVSANLLDLNVTPDKRTVFIHNEQSFLNNLRESLQEYFNNQEMTLFANSDQLKQSQINDSFEEVNVKKRKFDHQVKEDEKMMEEKSEQQTENYGGELEIFEPSTSFAPPRVEIIESSNTKSLEFEEETQPDEMDVEKDDADSELSDNVNIPPSITTYQNKSDFEDNEILESESAEESFRSADEASDPMKEPEFNDNSTQEYTVNKVQDQESYYRKTITPVNPRVTRKGFQTRIDAFAHHVDSHCKSHCSDAHSDDEDSDASDEEIIIDVDGTQTVEKIQSPRKQLSSSKSSSVRPDQEVAAEPVGENDSGDDFSESVDDIPRVINERVSQSNDLSLFRPSSSQIETSKLYMYETKLATDISLISERYKLNSNFVKQKHMSLFNKNEDISNKQAGEEYLSLTVAKSDFTKMKIVGQFNLGFIICTRKTESGKYDLFIVDQHASDEKFNFEMLQKTTKFKSQALIQPKPMELSVIDELIVLENLKTFSLNGFNLKVKNDDEVDANNPHSEHESVGKISIASLPYSKKTQFSFEDFYELVHLIKESPNPYNTSIRCSKIRAMFAMRACRTSIMIGKPLTMKTMKKVVYNLSELDKPWNCPHGRPTMRHLMELKDWDSFNNDYEL